MEGLFKSRGSPIKSLIFFGWDLFLIFFLFNQTPSKGNLKRSDLRKESLGKELWDVKCYEPL